MVPPQRFRGRLRVCGAPRRAGGGGRGRRPDRIPVVLAERLPGGRRPLLFGGLSYRRPDCSREWALSGMLIRILSLFPHALVCDGEWFWLPMLTGMSPSRSRGASLALAS